MIPDRRESIRLKRRCLVAYSRGHGSVNQGQTLDISETGARLLLDQAHSSPTSLALEFEGRLSLLARTVWCERESDGRRMVGVRFEGMDLGRRSALSCYLNDLVSRAS